MEFFMAEPTTAIPASLAETNTAINNTHMTSTQGSHAITSNRSQQFEAAHQDRLNLRAEQSLGNDDFNRNLQNQGALFVQHRQQIKTIEADANAKDDANFEKHFMRIRAIEQAFSVDTVEADSIRSVREAGKSSELADKALGIALAGKSMKSEMAMSPESGVAFKMANMNAVADQNRINTATSTAESAMKLAIAALKERTIAGKE
jgi:exonuclease V gamma subunit